MNRIEKCKEILVELLGAVSANDPYGDIFEMPNGRKVCARELVSRGIELTRKAIKSAIYDPYETMKTEYRNNHTEGVEECRNDMNPEWTAVGPIREPNKTMKNTENRINEIREELREIYQNDNEAPRLIQEMLKEFPSPRGPYSSQPSGPMAHNLG